MTRPRRFVWISTAESVRSGAVSFLACVEVVSAVALYWFIAFHYHTQVHLWVSILVAPLLLLRSDSSTAFGIRLFERYVDQNLAIAAIAQSPSRLLTTTAFYASLAFACVVIVYLSYYAASSFGHSGRTLFTILAYSLVGYLTTQFALALTVTFWVREIVALTQRRFVIIAVGTMLAASLVLGLDRANAAPLGIVAAAVIPLILTLIAAIEAPRAMQEAKQTAWSANQNELSGLVLARAARRAAGFSYMFFIPGFFVGSWLRSLLTRFVATILYIVEGVKALPNNWWRTLFVIDLKHPPDVIPGYHRDDPFNPSYYLSRFKSAESLARRYEHAVALIVLFVPAYLYRLSIKSTCWVYSPWIYLVRPPRLSSLPDYLADRLSKSLRERLRRYLAGLTLITLAASLIPQVAQTLAQMPAVVLSPLEYLFLIDFRSIKPWQWFNIASATITLLLIFLVNELRIARRHSKAYPRLSESIDWRAYWIERTMLIRAISTSALTLIVLVHALLWLSPIQDWLPDDVLTMLQNFYGSAFPARR